MIKYHNRYGDTYTFSYNERGNINWEGPFIGYRTGYEDNPEDIVMVDPSGGPYLTIGVNMRDRFGIRGEITGFIKHQEDDDIHWEIVIDEESQELGRKESNRNFNTENE